MRIQQDGLPIVVVTGNLMVYLITGRTVSMVYYFNPDWGGIPLPKRRLVTGLKNAKMLFKNRYRKKKNLHLNIAEGLLDDYIL
jgi:hypothetical protein